MLEHHLQKSILKKLSLKPTARFAEMRPKGVESNVFTYHLQELIRQKLVTKNADGTYAITNHGTYATAHLTHSPLEILKLAHSVLLIAIHDANNNWLLHHRITPPLQGMYGFLYAEPNVDERIVLTAQRTVQLKTGLSLGCTLRCSGYIRIYKDNVQQSFTQFNLLEATTDRREDIESDDIHWVSSPDFTSSNMMPSMFDLVSLLDKPAKYSFVELDYKL